MTIVADSSRECGDDEPIDDLTDDDNEEEVDLTWLFGLTPSEDISQLSASCDGKRGSGPVCRYGELASAGSPAALPDPGLDSREKQGVQGQDASAEVVDDNPGSIADSSHSHESTTTCDRSATDHLGTPEIP